MATAIINTIETLKTVGGLQGKDLANIVGVSPATVSRWASGTATPSIRTQTIIASLRYIVDRLAEFYTPDETRLWLNARHALLNNERAIDLINADQAQAVLAVIERMNDGVYL